MALWTPAEITTALWLDAAASGTIHLDGSSNVEQWDDKSGNANHLSQSTVGYRPSLTTMDSKDCLAFNDGHRLEGPTLGVGAGDFAVFVVATGGSVASESVYRGLFELGPYNSGGFLCAYYPLSTRRRFDIYNNSGLLNTPNSSYAGTGFGPIIVELIKDVGTSLAFWDTGAEIVSSTGSAQYAALSSEGAFILGDNSGTSSDWWVGNVAEVIVITDISATARQNIEGYLAWKWGLEGDLPVDHPYKSSAPELIISGKATGGWVTVENNYFTHTFTTSGTFTVLSDNLNVEYLVVGGGGGGGYNRGGGGGAGGLLTGSAYSVTPQSYAIVVGVGGDGSSSASLQGSDGGASSFNSISATGGGGGGTGAASVSLYGKDGGSGGGGGHNPIGSRPGGLGEAGPPRQGYDGGNADTTNGGGGGGAGEVGEAGATGIGGDGVESSINGTAIYYAGGGGGGGYNRAGGSGGQGGGGTGASQSGGVAATPGTANTGGGGGGGTDASRNGAAGGSGIVIIRYGPVYYFSGYVYEQGVPAADRIVRAYNRSTGLLVVETTSSGNGYYYLETSYSGAHYLVALDDDVGNSYNLARLDNIMPVEV